jgi:hypothetical protein
MVFLICAILFLMVTSLTPTVVANVLWFILSSFLMHAKCWRAAGPDGVGARPEHKVKQTRDLETPGISPV